MTAIVFHRCAYSTLPINGSADRTVSPEHSIQYPAALQEVGLPCDLLLDDTKQLFCLWSLTKIPELVNLHFEVFSGAHEFAYSDDGIGFVVKTITA